MIEGDQAAAKTLPNWLNLKLVRGLESQGKEYYIQYIYILYI